MIILTNNQIGIPESILYKEMREKEKLFLTVQGQLKIVEGMMEFFKIPV